ncbi:MAG: MFS transporter [Rhodospirillales bacterium]|nr:MAG: MFS transporter [Rhodospirillales bacterium]
MTIPPVKGDIGSQLPAHPRLTVLVLAICQVLAMTAAFMIIVVSALAGQMLAADKSLATLPVSLMFVGNMAMTIPASLLMKRVGRRVGFTVGAAFGIGAALVGTWGLLSGNFTIFALGGLLQGCYNAFWQYYRFAAADAVTEDYKSRAISYVLLGGVVAAVIGRELAEFTAGLVQAAQFAGSYLAMAALAAFAMVLIQLIAIPPPSEEERAGAGRPLQEISRQPTFLIAVLAAMIGYGSMALVMTATPLAMQGHGHSFPDTTFVIQWHALGMFVPSFFTGHLIRHFGAVRIILAGTVAMLAMIAVNMSGAGMLEYWSALLLLGIGWNFMFIGGSTLLTEVYTLPEKAKVQGINDFLVFGANAVASLSSGVIFARFGWLAVSYAVILPMIVVLVAAVWLRLKRRAAQHTGAAPTA